MTFVKNFLIKPLMHVIERHKMPHCCQLVCVCLCVVSVSDGILLVAIFSEPEDLTDTGWGFELSHLPGSCLSELGVEMSQFCLTNKPTGNKSSSLKLLVDDEISQCNATYMYV